MTSEQKLWGLLRRRQCLLPTWRGWLALFAILATLVFLLGRQAHSFLAVTQPVSGGALVVEGWASDFALEETLAEFKRGPYERVYVTGGPIEAGAPLVEYKSYAERGAAVLLKLGLSTNEVQAVPAPLVRQDRTYTATIALRDWLRRHETPATRVHLISEGPHARRSWLLLQKALGKKVQVGVTAVRVRDYDAEHWWRSSAGVRGVIGEALAYAYARLWFRPEPEPAP